MRERTALVLGCGDVGSAVALALWRGGFATVLADVARPAAIRRGMAFTDAWFAGSATLDGVTACFVSASRFDGAAHTHAAGIVATDLDSMAFMRDVGAAVLVDARMRKRGPAPQLRGLAPLTIGAGPGFVATGHVDVVIETAWGAALGAVCFCGSAAAYDGRPREVAGYGRDRYLYAAQGGVFRTAARIGQRVGAGEIVGTLDGEPCAAPLDGVLRGLAADGAMVFAGKKVIEVDPTGERAACFGIAPRAAKIADGVLEAVRSARAAPARS